jgi:hypothetical protein
MATRVETDMSQFEELMKDRPWHRWPGRLPYRKSGASWAQPGDLALCGTVKKGMSMGVRSGPGCVTCPECLRLIEAGL